MTERVKKKGFHVNRIEKRGPVLIKAYRKWRDAIGSRPYLLEQLPAAVEEQPFLWPTITFGWLFGVKRVSGEFYSDKVHARAYGKVGNGNGTEKEYLALARRVGMWQRDHNHLYVGDSGSYEHAFESGTGISWPRWGQLRKQFNGSGAGA